MASQSMPRFARMIGEAMQARGHEVVYWAPHGTVHGLFKQSRLAKWAGYVDQFILFPMVVRQRLKQARPDTLFVFCDQALGPWVPLVRHLPHVVHAHDLLALRSALGQIPQNPTSWSGRLYQRYIRSGFQHARHFICVSGRTQTDLVAHGHVRPDTSRIVYNGLNYPYKPVTMECAIRTMRRAGLPDPGAGMILHVGGGQWYKNTAGVIQLYAHYARRHAQPLPLWMISPTPSAPDVVAALAQVPDQGRVLFFQGIDNLALQSAYSVAKAFLFPSLAEGFGWPLIEAQACGCPVITTDDAPMNEVAGPQAHYLPMPGHQDDLGPWAQAGADVLGKVLHEQDTASASALQAARQARIAWAGRFTTQAAIEAYLEVYRDVIGAKARRHQGAGA